ncbi:hypothetical protein [Vibrio owensii]|uniref:hypothetical protein n=1 Tax=Vibrio owensii TaxID=696485 RepID=UPI0018F13A75|nr:hypothetical protein [Vibrio owensii]
MFKCVMLALLSAFTAHSHANNFYEAGTTALKNKEYIGCLENLIAYRESKRTELSSNKTFSNTLDKNIDFCRAQLKKIVSVAKEKPSPLLNDLGLNSFSSSISASSHETPRKPYEITIEGNGISVVTDRATLVKGILADEKSYQSGQLKLTPEQNKLIQEVMNTERHEFFKNEITTVDPEIMNRIVNQD